MQSASAHPDKALYRILGALAPVKKSRVKAKAIDATVTCLIAMREVICARSLIHCPDTRTTYLPQYCTWSKEFEAEFGTHDFLLEGDRIGPSCRCSCNLPTFQQKSFAKRQVVDCKHDRITNNLSAATTSDHNHRVYLQTRCLVIGISWDASSTC